MLEEYTGSGRRLQGTTDGRLVLSNFRDVKLFAGYLRKQAAKQAPGTKCYYAWTWHLPVDGLAVLILDHLSLDPKVRDQPWRRDKFEEIKSDDPTEFAGDSLLAELANHLEWYYPPTLRIQQKKYKVTIEEARRKRKEEHRKKMEELENELKAQEKELAIKGKLVDDKCNWQLRESPSLELESEAFEEEEPAVVEEAPQEPTRTGRGAATTGRGRGQLAPAAEIAQTQPQSSRRGRPAAIRASAAVRNSSAANPSDAE